MIIETGLNSEDFKSITSKIKRANVEQLTFIIEAIKTEIVKRNNQ